MGEGTNEVGFSSLALGDDARRSCMGIRLGILRRMADVRERFEGRVMELAQQMDAGSVRALYQAASVDVVAERERLERLGLVHGAQAGARPEELARSARKMIRRTTFRATALGGAGGAVGLASVPPEIAAMLIVQLRLAQRLAIVYGFDPESERGRVAIRQALSEAFELDLSEGGPLGIVASDLILVGKQGRPSPVTVRLAQTMIRRSAWMVVGRLTRFVPGLGVVVGALQNRKKTLDYGERLRASFARSAGWSEFDERPVVEATEVPKPHHG